MSKFCLVFEKEDGGVSIVYPAPGVDESVAAQAVPEGRKYCVCNPGDIPSDREFREAWVSDDGMVSVDLTKARAIKHCERRRARDDAMKPLDIKSTIPSESVGAEKARSKIREHFAVIQKQIDESSSVAELKAVRFGMI
jgi:hypothetical protein